MMTTKLASYNNAWYRPGSRIRRMLWYPVNIIFFTSSWFPIYGFKRMMLRLFGASIGRNVLIKPGVNIKYPWLLTIEDNVWIGEKVWIDNLAPVHVGPDVCLSQGALLLCGNHNYKKPSFDLIVQPIVLEAGVWIGAKAVVSGGVTCRSHAVLSVSSVASRDLDAYSIYRGNPAVKTGERIISEE